MKKINADIDFTEQGIDFYRCRICGKIIPMKYKEPPPECGYIYCPVCNVMPICDLYMTNL